MKIKSIIFATPLLSTCIEQLQLYTQPTIRGKNIKLQFGCGFNHFSDWINSDLPSSFIDFKKKPNAYINIIKKLPVESAACSFLYSEHLIEHISHQEALPFAKECYRVLVDGGVVRIATPDLEHLVKKYQSKKWKDQEWLTWPEYQFIETPAKMLNVVMRWWGHKFVYDYHSLYNLFKDAGFSQIRRQKWGKSNYSEFEKREQRKDSLLILEAKK